MTAEEGRGQQGHDDQVSSEGGRGERRGDRQGEREANSERLSGGIDEALDEDTEEGSMPAGEQEGSEDMLTASPWGTQESGAGGLQVNARAGRSNESKASSAIANEAGKQVRHKSRQGKGEH